MSSAAKPTFVCFHGSWHSPACFDKIKHLLSTHGFSCICPALPSTGAEPPVDAFTKDVETIRSTVSELVEAKKDVIVVTHSYSGIPGGQALEGLDTETRKKNGYEGGVIRLIYIMSFLVPEGFQHSPRGTRDNMVPAMKTDFEVSFLPSSSLRRPCFFFRLNCDSQNGIVTVEPEDAKGLFYQDLPDDVALTLGKDLRPQSLDVYWSTTSFAAWKHIPTTYVICEDDKPSTVAAVTYLVSNAQAADGNKIDRVLRHKVGHSPFLSQPDWTAGMLMEEAGQRAGAGLS